MPKSEANQLILVLDAAGVIYERGNDVDDLLIPYIEQRGGLNDRRRVCDLYLDACVGKINAKTFWREVGLDPALEDEYLQLVKITPGILEFLNEANQRFRAIWCCCNDVSEWSMKLRQRYQLPRLITGFLVSGDVGVRKPDMKIFELLLHRLNTVPENILFVDDHEKNLSVAKSVGCKTLYFGKQPPGKANGHPRATTPREIFSV